MIPPNNIFVDLESPIEVEAMGVLLGEINIENDKGVDVSTLYYSSGIKQFDDLLNYKPFYEYGLTFHLCSYENAIAFVLYHPQKQIYADRIAFWRTSITKGGQQNELQLLDFVKQNALLNSVKLGVAGSGAGLVGSLVSRATGTVISNLRGVKTKCLPAIVYQFEFGEKICVLVYTKSENETKVGGFLETHFRSTLDKSMLQRSDSYCFVATACYSKLSVVELITLRNFRDQYLNTRLFGKIFIRCYYFFSPLLVKALGLKTKIFVRKYILYKIHNLIVGKYYGPRG